MPVSADLLKVLAEDPKSLEQQLGCMTGLFQIFDRQGLGRRYGSKRVSNAASGQSQPTSACETPRHDRSNPYWMFEDDSSQRISSDSFDRPKSGVVDSSTREHHHRAYSDSSEIFTKSFETPTESRTSPDEKSNLDNSPMYSEESVGGLTFYYNDPARESTLNSATSKYPFGHHDLISTDHSCKKLNVVIPPRATPDPKAQSSDIRDIVRASFDRDQRSRGDFVSSKEKPRLSVDGSHSHIHVHSQSQSQSQGQGYLKNLPRSSSVDGKDRLRLSVDGRIDTGVARQQPTDLPRSCSVGGRGASRMLADWKDSLRNSGGSPRLTVKEKDMLRQSSEQLARNSVSKYQSVNEGRDATRLTVELKEGPRLSVSGDDRRASVDGKVSVSPRPISRFRETCELPLATPDFKESLRAAEIKEFLRGSQKGAGSREGHRFSVDGTRDAPRACIAPRLSVDGRDSENSSTLVPRKLKLDNVDRCGLKESNEYSAAQFCRQSSGRGNVEGDVRRKGPNVVARLMGLDELPSSKAMFALTPKGAERSSTKETDVLFQEFLRYHPMQGGSPPPPPSPPDDYDYAHRSSDHEDLQPRRFAGPRMRRSEHDYQPYESVHDHFSSQHHYFQQEPQNVATPQQLEQASKEVSPDAVSVVKQPAEEHSTPVCKPHCEDTVEQKEQRPVRKSPQGRRSLWHIFEAMQLKSLLNGSSRRKSAEAVRLQNLKMAEEKEGLEVRARSQSLPPRLSASKDLDFQDTRSGSHVPNPRALEQKKGSGLDHGQKIAPDADDESIVVVKPIITRSMSYKSQGSAAAPNQPSALVSSKTDCAEMYIPDKDISPQNISRELIRNAYHRAAHAHEMSLTAQAPEPLQAADISSYSQTTSSGSANARQSRKERGAPRMTKSFSDVPQSGRDSSSPKGPRSSATNTPEKPARSCSPRPDSASSVSPRCPGSVEGMNRLMDAGKVRRKAYPLKDKEEIKATLANLRANATKQEFLKGRASGDPDTPRLLRRSSSESKLLSKIAEKPITADIPTARAPGARSAPNMSPLLRSKRPVSKDNKSPMKTRPTSALNLKTVTKPSSAKDQTGHTSYVNRATLGYNSVPETVTTTAQEQKPGVQASSRSSLSEVRAIQGGALDHSADASHSNARERRMEPKPVQERTIEIDEGVKTPRGVSIKKIDFSEDAQADVAEQPSPVSVLDNFHFDEELTPSPKAGKTTVVSLQESQSLRLEKDRRWSSARFLDLDLEDNTSPTALMKVPEPAADAASAADFDVIVQDKRIPAPQVPLLKTSSHRTRLRVCLKDAEEERIYVEDLVEASELASGCTSPEFLTSSPNYVMDLSVFDQLETKRRRFESDETDLLDRRILFDCVNEVLDEVLQTQSSCLRWTGAKLLQPSLRKRPVGKQLVKKVFAELGEIPCAASEDVCDTVYVILQNDLVRGRGQQWSDYYKELEEVGLDVEKLIVKDLIDETVRELGAGLRQKSVAAAESSRRQLFA